MNQFQHDLSQVRAFDGADALSKYRKSFHIPIIDGKEVIYFTGNSLGLQPKGVREAINQELDDWAKWGVEGHFHAKNPWFSYHELFTAGAARLVGAKENEVVLMNGLTVNLHLLLTSFYRPTKARFKILCEKKAFPSDQYALESQIKLHGLRLEDALIEVGPREGSELIATEDILAAIEAHGDELACVMIGGVNYYSGQVFDMKTITAAAHKVGAYCGFDLAHAAGNIPMQLHDWNVDFACWCTYKYLNSGPGSISGAFVHERNGVDKNLPRMAGWWGHDKDERFLMEPGFRPIPGAEGWQLSNAPVLAMTAHKVALDLFDEVGMSALREKSLKLSDYLMFEIDRISAKLSKGRLEIITPRAHDARGSQVSVVAHGFGKALFDQLTKEGVIADWREPNVIRMAPVPFYNSFEDIYRFAEILEAACEA